MIPMTSLTQSFLKSALESPWLNSKIQHPTKIPAILRLLDYREDVLDLQDLEPNDLKLYFQAALIFRDEATKNRQSVSSTSTEQSSLASSVFSEIPDSRNSVISNLTNSSIASQRSTRPAQTATEHNPSLTSLSASAESYAVSRTHTATPRARSVLTKEKKQKEEKKYKCPTCPAGASRYSDFVRHLRGYCEKPQQGFKCLECGVLEKESASIQTHGLLNNHNHWSDVELPSKRAFGCPYCGSLHYDLDAYARCMCEDQKADTELRPDPLLRLTALLKQEGIGNLLARQCRDRDLDSNAWTSMMWDSADAVEFAKKLEYGCDGDERYRGLGVDDLEAFSDQVMNAAKYKDSGKPVPLMKDTAESQAREILLRDISESIPSNGQPSEPFTQEVQHQYSHYLAWRSSEPSLTEARNRNKTQELTASILKGSHAGELHSTPWGHIQPKRPPSTSSSSLKEARSRSKHPPAVRHTATEMASPVDIPPLSDESGFPFPWDSALRDMSHAFSEFEEAKAQRPSCSNAPTDDDFDNVFYYDLNDCYGLDGMIYGNAE